MHLRITLLIVSLLMTIGLTSQTTSASVNQEPVIDSESLKGISLENIGPSVFGGRVVDLDVNPEQPAEFYVAYASGGLWHTANNGTTFSPVFDHEPSMTIGDIAVHWPSGTIYIGTGEVNSSRSSYAGTGMYKSTDSGATWEYLGLPESHHIGRVLIHAVDTAVVNVAVLGHLYTTNSERGMYRSTDGGATWQQTLAINNNTGAVDLVAHPTDANTLYCATWERARAAWDFTEAGAGSGIYKSTDAGASWTAISNTASGFPQGEGTGRIGLDVAVEDGTTYLYAILDNYNRRPKDDTQKKGLQKDDFVDIDAAAFASLADDELQAYLDDNGFDEKYSAKEVKKLVASGEVKPLALKEYIEDANRMLFDTPVIGAEVYLTTDSGAAWTKTHEGYIDGLYNSYGYYFGQVRVNPTDINQLYIMGVPILRSDDGGATWKNVNGDNVHVDHHALWINPEHPDHIINGNDGGVNISYDAGENWTKCTSPAVGQFYYINVDSAENYSVYGGTQDNGVWVGSHDYEAGTRWQMTGKYPYKTIMGGDGMQVQIDSRDNSTVYTGYQFGNYFRVNTKSGQRSYITPKHALGDRPYRWNWQSPIILSPHNQDIVYFGANKLLRSMDQGETWVEISEDLTQGGKVGDVAFGTLTTVSESPLQFGLIYTGSDDGEAHVTKDGGITWTNISRGLPADLWISRIVSSNHDKATVYVAVNGYRHDVMKPYVYVSKDYGATWTPLHQALPDYPVNVIKEDMIDEGLLYLGTDHGAYVSADKGSSFMLIADLPHVPVHDMVIHYQSGDILIGTHGRSIYKTNKEAVLAYRNMKENVALLSIPTVRHSSRWGSQRAVYTDVYQPEVIISVVSKTPATGTLSIEKEDQVLYIHKMQLATGINRVASNLIIDQSAAKKLQKMLSKQKKEKVELTAGENGSYYLPVGEYTLKLRSGSAVSTKTLIIEE